IAAKQTLLEHQTLEDRCVLGPPGSGAPEATRPIAAQAFLSDHLDIDLAIPGRPNPVTARLALAARGLARGAPRPAAARPRRFPGLPHRLEKVGEHRGAAIFNDSKSTPPQAARLALESFPAGVVHAILGGYDKGSDLGD